MKKETNVNSIQLHTHISNDTSLVINTIITYIQHGYAEIEPFEMIQSSNKNI